MELERSVWGSAFSDFWWPMAGERWKARCKKLCRCFSPPPSLPLLSPFLPPHLSCGASFHSREIILRGSARHIFLLCFLSSLQASYFFPSPPFLYTLSRRYNMLHGGRKNNPHRFRLSELAKSFELLGFWMLLCYLVVFALMMPWMMAC